MVASTAHVLMPFQARLHFLTMRMWDGRLAATCGGCVTLSLWSPQAMARRRVRRSVRMESGTDQVGGAKQRPGHAVYPPLEQRAINSIHYTPQAPLTWMLAPFT